MKIILLLMTFILAGCFNNEGVIGQKIEEKQYDFTSSYSTDKEDCMARDNYVKIDYSLYPDSVFFKGDRYIALKFKKDSLNLSVESDNEHNNEVSDGLYLEYDEKTLTRVKYYLNDENERNLYSGKLDPGGFINRLNNSPVIRDFVHINFSLLFNDGEIKDYHDALSCAKYRIEEIQKIVKDKYL